jgi:D-beta-D-heptose 7-phosphate kinase/D-beta-D-heptose 1-phosphate adenosyltransferase
VLAALAAVDAVVVFEEDTPAALVDRLAPDVLVKGADYGAEEIVGRETVEARGGRVVRVSLLAGRSTSELVREIVRRYAGKV